MPTNTSATGGYLTPATTPGPLEGNSFEDFLQQVLTGLSGLGPTAVRPRWQPEPPNQPDFPSDWLAFGIMRQNKDTFAYIGHDSDGDGTDYLFRQEDVEVLLSSYGTNAEAIIDQISDGFQIGQNLAVLSSAGIGHTDASDPRAAPVIMKTQWVKRFDMTWYFKRAIRRVYPVLNLLSAQGVIQTSSGFADPFIVTQT